MAREVALLALIQCFLVAGALAQRAPAPDVLAALPASSRLRTSAAGGAEAANPLLASSQFPLWDQIRPEHVRPAVEQLFAEESASLQLLELDLANAGANVTFEQLFLPLTQIRLRADTITGQVSHLNNVVTSPALRAAVESITPLQVAFDLKLGQSRSVYDALLRLKEPARWAALSAPQRRLVQRTLQDMANNGVGLAGEQRERFNEIRNRLEELQNRFSNNVLDSQAAFKVLITNKSELAGVGLQGLGLAAQNARDDGHPDATAEAGPWLIKLDNTAPAVMGSAENRELREKVYKADKTIASDGQYDNTPLITEILTLRKELAGLLGFSNWAEYRSTTRMASVQQATDLMEQIVSASQPAAIREHASLVAFARNATSDPDMELLWWDMEFWTQRQMEALFNLKQEELQEYLPLDSVMEGLWKLAERAYGIRVTKLSGADRPPVWHRDVDVFAVSNADAPGQPIAYFYTDLYARPGSKSGGAWENGIVTGSELWLAPSPAAAIAKGQPAGSALSYSPRLAEAQAAWLAAAPRMLPIVMIVSNQNPPVPSEGKPSLMSLRQAETLFHEFGHATQDMLTTVKGLGLMAGIRNIELDAIEIPSMHQEKWVYSHDTFMSIARHWRTGERVPEAMYGQVKAMQRFRKGSGFVGQMGRVLTDIRLHSDYDPAGPLSPHDLYLNIAARVAPMMPPWQGNRFLNGFRHPFYYGYDAGYYSYYWADVMSADIHGAFAEAGMDDQAATAALGRRYRDTFLSLGGSVAPSEVFERFMGRTPSIQHWLEYNGL